MTVMGRRQTIAMASMGANEHQADGNELDTARTISIATGMCPPHAQTFDNNNKSAPTPKAKYTTVTM